MTRQTNHIFSLFTNHRYWGVALIALFTCLIPSQDILAQDLGGGQIDTGGIDQLQQLEQTQGGGGTGTGVGDDGFDLFDGERPEFFTGTTSDDVRNQGFVGATGTKIQELGFVGQAGELSGPPLADGASFGGGVNESAGGGGGGGGFGNANAGRNQSGFGAIGQGKGFQVIRKGVRTSLTPRFAAPAYGTNEISNRFNNRIGRQPVIRNDGGGLFVTINNRVATVTGYAETEAQRSRFIRQLRLEPGIDHINDQISRQ